MFQGKTGAHGGPSGRSTRTALITAVAATYGSGLWLHLVHRAQAVPTGQALPLWAAWLRDATLVAPLVFAAVLLVWSLAGRLSARVRPWLGERGASLAAAAVVALGASLTMALMVPLSKWLLPGDSQGAAAVAQDALVAFPVALAITALVLWMSGRARLPLPRLGRVVLSGALALSSLGAAPLTGLARAQTPAGSPPCPETAPVKTFDLTAIDVDIPLNRMGDHDPLGKMYALSKDVGAIRADEARYAAERASNRPVSVSIGLRKDLIQPLVIRANMGDCVEITFTNDASGGSYGVHIDGLSFEIDSSGDAIGFNPSSAAARGETRAYRYYVPNDRTLEGAHYLHPGPGWRNPVAHGLFGALVVEPAGSRYLDPEDTTQEIESGWEAIIDAPASACDDPEGQCDFREAAQLWHEVGIENYTPRDRRGGELPMIEDITGAYRPGGRAINYRSEPFMDRMLPAGLRDEKSHTYSSYTFGDPPTTIPRSYLGDPMKFRLMHVGTEMFHVFHLHGGGIRWRQNPLADPTNDYSDTGLDKDPPTKLSPSNRLDSQAIGPGESFNLEIEGGAGGVQQAAGDFLFHCHIAHHYFAGMWSFWRTYDTLQPDLAPLPDRAPLPPAVDSSELIGKTMPDGTTLTAGNLDEWIDPQLPPQGRPRNDQDASVWNWSVDGSVPAAPVYLGEPEDGGPWPVPNGQSGVWPNLSEGVDGHLGSLPVDEFVGNRPKILFNPLNGRPAYPLLRTHVGKRPPFSPNGHSGAPWLGERGGVESGAEVNPWAGRADGICPACAPERDFDLVSIRKPAPVTPTANDPQASVFTLAKDKADVLAGRKPVEPLAIRANMGECVTGTYTTELPESPAFTKSNLHIHHVQFDVQASDGVVSGFAYEQSIRPYKLEDPRLTMEALAGTRVLQLSNLPASSSIAPNGAPGQKLRPGVWIGIGLGTEGIEVAQIESISGNTVTLATPLKQRHGAGQWAGTEFTQFRWFPDVGLDNIFWHDHVDGINGWGHGMVGQLIIEPPGSTYHDPETGEEVASGNIVDIHTPGTTFPGVVEGSFRELALWTIDDNPVAGSMLNLRAEPWAGRTPDPSLRFSSYAHGDPNTPLPRAYPGDPLVVRTINVGPTVDTLHVDGHRFSIEGRYLDENGKVEASPTDTLHYGVSEKYSFALEGGAGGVNREPGDYLYMNGIGRRFRQGAWGIIRVLDGSDASLKPLPGHPAPAAPSTLPSQTGGRPPRSGPGDPCPVGAPTRSFDVSAVDLPGAGHPRAAFVPTAIAADAEAGRVSPEPLVLHAAAGECIDVRFKNERATARASFHVSELVRDIGSSGVDVGFNPEQTVAPNGTKNFRFFADTAKVGAAIVTDFGGSDTGAQGLYGAIVIAPQGARFTDPVTGDVSDTGSPVDVHCPSACTADGNRHYRDYALALFENDPIIGTDDTRYPTQVAGPATINYRSAPRPDGAGMFSSVVHGDPATPLIEAHAGDPLRIHAYVAPGSEAMHTFTLGGMDWPSDPNIHDANEVGAQGVGPWETLEADVLGGAGGREHAVGDFFYGDLRRMYSQAGMWGLIRVLPRSGSEACAIDALDRPSCPNLAAVSDSGRSDSDDLTNDASATFTGRAEAGTTVALQADGTSVGTAPVGDDRRYSVDADLSALADGEHVITATSTDPAGVTTAPSGSLHVTLDRIGPTQPAEPDLAAASDTGVSDTDNLTRDTAPILSGTSEARADVQVLVDGSATGSGRADATGAFSVQSSSIADLADGAHRLSVVATDRAGNASDASPELEIELDTAAPSEAPAAPDLDPKSDTGRSRADNVTKLRRVTVTGASAPEDAARVELVVGGTRLASVSPSDGYSLSATLPTGRSSVRVVASDEAGNTSRASAALRVRIDRKAPRLGAARVSPTPFNPRRQPAVRIASSVSEAAAVKGIIRLGSKPIRALASKRLARRGSFVLRWDGKNERGRDVAGDVYRVVMKATDVAGNRGRRRASVRISYR